MERYVFIIGVCCCLIGQYECATRLNAATTPSYIYSIHYPSNYDNNIYQEWEIVTSVSGHVINVLAEDQDLETGRYCSYDSIKAYNGLTLHRSARLQSVCGSSPRLYTSSSGPDMTLVFSTDTSHTRRGFKIKYWSSLSSQALVTTTATPYLRSAKSGWNVYLVYIVIVFVVTISVVVVVIYRVRKRHLNMRASTMKTVSKNVTLNSQGRLVTTYQTKFIQQNGQRKNPSPKVGPTPPPQPPPPQPPPPYPHSSQDPGPSQSNVDNPVLEAPQFSNVPPAFNYVTPPNRNAYGTPAYPPQYGMMS